MSHQSKFIVNRQLLEETSSNKSAFKSLGMVVMLKSRFVSSAVTCYTPKKVSEITGLSPKTVAKYVAICIEKGWAHRMDDGRLIFRPIHDKSNRSCKKSARVFVRGHETVKQITDKLYAAIMEASYNYREMRSIRRINATDALRKQGEGAYKAARYLKKLGRNETNLTRTISGMPYSVIADSFSCSTTTAQRWIKRMAENKLIVKTRHIEIAYSGKDAATRFSSMVEEYNGQQGYWTQDCRHKDNVKMVFVVLDKFQRLCLNKKRNAILLITPNTYQFNTEEMLVGPYSPKCALPKNYTPCHNVMVNGKLIKTKSKLDSLSIISNGYSSSTVNRSFDMGGVSAVKEFYNEVRVIR